MVWVRPGSSRARTRCTKRYGTLFHHSDLRAQEVVPDIIESNSGNNLYYGFFIALQFPKQKQYSKVLQVRLLFPVLYSIQKHRFASSQQVVGKIPLEERRLIIPPRCKLRLQRLVDSKKAACRVRQKCSRRFQHQSSLRAVSNFAKRWHHV